MSNRILSLAGGALAGILALAPMAGAQILTPIGQARADVGLAPGWAEPDGRRIAGLLMQLDDGWKTYWRSPGDSGAPPRFDWSGSTNVAEIEVIWPRPEIFESFGLRTLGYSHAVALPVRVTPVDPAQPIGLALGLDYGVCSDICLIERADLALAIAPGDEGAAALIGAALSMAALPAAEAGVTHARCAVSGAGRERGFAAEIALAEPFGEPPLMVVEGPEDIWFAEPVVTLADGGLSASGDAKVYGDAPWIDRSALRLTLLGGDRAIDIRGCAPLDG